MILWSCRETCYDIVVMQGDLCEDDVMLLDNGQVIYVWVGKFANEMAKKLTLMGIQVGNSV